MVIDKTLKCIGLLFITSSLLQAQGANAMEPRKESKKASQFARERGKIVTKEAAIWMLDKKIPAGWITLENKYFIISYPKCINIQGEGEEDDPKLTSSIAFLSSPNCPSLTQKLDKWEVFGVMYEDGVSPERNIDNIIESNVLKLQKLIINGIPAKFFTLVTDSNVGDATGTLIQMRQKIYLLCGEKVMSITYDSPRGDISLQKIERNEFEFPDNLKKIVSTFQCPKNKKKH